MTTTLKHLCPPRFRAMYHAPISSGKRIGQSATSGATNFEIAVKSRIPAEFVTDASLGIEHEDRLLDKKHEIKPFVGGITKQPVIEITSINIDNRSFLIHRKCKGLGFPKPCAASPKVGGLTWNR